MSLVINTNVASLSAQNSIGRAQMDQNEAMERLTTGKRINTAADDAAGLSIANKMTSQIKGLNQAVRNANDGISMLQTAAGGLEESNNILQRMRELAVQSASGTYDQGNRDSMNAEVTQLKAELDRISETTTFNGQKILDGSKQNTSLQVGANSNETISFDIDSTSSKKLGGNSADLTGAVPGAATLYQGLTNITNAVDMVINDQQVDNLGTAGGNTALQHQLDTISKVAGVEAGALVEWTAENVGDGVLQNNNGLVLEVVGIDVDFADYATHRQEFRITDTGNMQELVDAINLQAGAYVEASLTDEGKLNIASTNSAQIEVRATNAINGAAGNNDAVATSALGDTTAGADTQQAQLTLTSTNGEPITVTYNDAEDANNIGINASREKGQTSGYTSANGSNNISSGDMILNGVALGEYDQTIDYDGNGTAQQRSDLVSWINSHTDQTGVIAQDGTLDATNGLLLTSTDGTPISIEYKDDTTATAMEAIVGFNEQNAQESTSGNVAGISVATAADAQKAIATLDKAIEQVSTIQGELGAVNNRLDFTVSNLNNVSENASAARSRIEDADFAAESANLSRAQVLQQAGQAMLAQANSAPQQVLSLLQ